MFTAEQERAIAEKLSQLKRIKNGTLTPDDLALSITGRRMKWLSSNFRNVLAKHKGLKLDELAYRAIYFDHMGITPEDSHMTRISFNKIRVDSYNFCPYLIACQELGLDTRIICKEIVEPGIQAVCQVIHPNLVFSRNYDNLRPQNPLFCEEYIELKTQ